MAARARTGVTADERLTTTVVRGVPVLAIGGEVDISNAARVAAAMDRAQSGDPRGVVVDLRETHYLESAGIRLLFELRRRLVGRSARLVLILVDGDPAESVLRHTGLLDVVPTASTLEPALSAVLEDAGTSRAGSSPDHARHGPAATPD